jgi:hypothetical protein
VSNGGHTYNHDVRSFVAVVVMLVFATLIAVDGLCCPDGCTHEQQAAAQQHDQEPGAGSCMLCLGGIDSAAPQALAPSGIVTNRVGPQPSMSHLDAVTNPPEHPPRA